ncbi:TRAP transporter small permease [Pseudoalteromonas spongiae]|uniref:TRAP transporter small permease n=1 Tax=Pseudoalteromonas spongiae TaxID=298657 RepID=UPI003734C65B
MLNKLNAFNMKVSILLIVAIFLLVLSQIVLRLFNLYIPSLNEICGYLLISSFFLALGYSFEQEKHIRVALVFEFDNPNLSHYAQVVSYLTATLICAFISYACIQLTLDSYHFHEVSSGEIAILEWPIQAIMAYASCVTTITIAFKGLEVLRGHS